MPGSRELGGHLVCDHAAERVASQKAGVFSDHGTDLTNGGINDRVQTSLGVDHVEPGWILYHQKAKLFLKSAAESHKRSIVSCCARHQYEQRPCVAAALALLFLAAAAASQRSTNRKRQALHRGMGEQRRKRQTCAEPLVAFADKPERVKGITAEIEIVIADPDTVILEPITPNLEGLLFDIISRLSANALDGLQGDSFCVR